VFPFEPPGANRHGPETAMWEAGPNRTNSHEHVYRRISLASWGQNVSQQNQQLNLVGGCNAFEYECSGCSNWNPFGKTEKRKNAANSNVF
jgi:hypothetical protein